jgi:hypothetical protein
MSQHEHFHFSVTIKCEELFILGALRGLAWQCQSQINRHIATSGARNDEWKRNQGDATFYFTSTANRAEFLNEATLLFKTGWEKIGRDDRQTPPRKRSN